MMRADYDSEGDTIQIVLEPCDRVDYGEDVAGGAVVVSILDERPVIIDVIGTAIDIRQPLRSAAERYGLDAENLIAAAHAALAAPDRTVSLDIAVRAGA